MSEAYSSQRSVSLTYRSNTEEARRQAAMRKQKSRMKSVSDSTAQYGPPDRPCNFLSRKRERSLDSESGEGASKKIASSCIKLIPNANPGAIGKNVRMKFEIKAGVEKWYAGMICSYNAITGKYGVYFPCDEQIVETSLEDSDLEIMADESDCEMNQ